MKIAIAGKGGSGKTLVAGSFSYLLARAGYKTLAIDADSAPNLGSLLGLSAPETTTIMPVSKNEDLISTKTKTGYPGVYSLNFSVADVIGKYAVPTPTGAHLLVMGTVSSMGGGCTCPANSVIRALLRHLLVERDEMVVLDMEAGVEHLGRGTAENVDIMLVASDANRQSLAIAETILRMAQDAGIPRTALIGNKIANPGQEQIIQDFARTREIAIAGMIPSDDTVTKAGITGDSVISLQNSPAFAAIREILAGICMVANENTSLQNGKTTL
ncbi:MAG: AAA family ATPase [Methanoregula sp.]|uniref:ATP-binding protein n=1 Tax=Methanoregula sp. TaxID=2052170 RepID=UPI003BB1F2F2